MEARELRIGNEVMILKKDNLKSPSFWWENHKIDEDDFWHISNDAYKPIPLTEEWLLKFGFELKLGNYELPNFRFHINEPMNYDGYLFCEGYSVITKNIKFVHQLQNLYFALTGEELTIKQ